jgi:hypothetical protein
MRCHLIEIKFNSFHMTICCCSWREINSVKRAREELPRQAGDDDARDRETRSPEEGRKVLNQHAE